MVRANSDVPGSMPALIPTTPVPLDGAVSRARIEWVFAWVLGGFGFIFAIQSVPAIIESLNYLLPLWRIVVPATLLALIGAMLIAALLRKGVKLWAGVFALAFLIALLGWPGYVANPQMDYFDQPWPWYLCTIATAAAAVCFGPRLAAAYAVAVPIGYFGIRLLPSGGGVSWQLAALDAFYILSLGVIGVIVVTVLRQSADRVDTAQRIAISRHTEAAQSAAIEAERIHVDSLVHDDVLTTLLSAAKSTSSMQRDSVVSLAGNALATLQESDPERAPEPDVPLSELSRRLTSAARVLLLDLNIIERGIDDRSIPAVVSEALYSATIQALVNSAQHASPNQEQAMRGLSFLADPEQLDLTIVIADTGIGFDRHAVSVERLGLRFSIEERLAAIGGIARIYSIEGGGTSVVLAWSEREGQEY